MTIVRARGSSSLIPLSSVWEWQSSARCTGLDSNLFFSPDGERGEARIHRQNRAKEICANCPVRYQCGDFAIRTQQPFGIWGGMTEMERSPVLLDSALSREQNAV
jgi:WhiB family transcriptional regulator, redox-sensing transcriptional regulator